MGAFQTAQNCTVWSCVRTSSRNLTEHNNQLGEYKVNLDQDAPEPVYEFRSARQRT